MIGETYDLDQYPTTCCCLCGRAVTGECDKNTCSLCLKRVSVNYSNIPKKVTIRHCRDCQRFEKPPFVYAEWESQEFLRIVISKIRELRGARIKFARFTTSNPERCEIPLQLVLSSLSDNEIDENVTILIKICDVQCDDCKRTFTPHLWIAVVQLRERNGDGTNLRYIENCVMRDAVKNIIRDVKREEHGLDFSFSEHKDAIKFREFVQSRILSRSKSSKHLISHNTHSSKYNYKYDTVVEIASIAANDLVALPRDLCQMLGGIGSLNLVTKVSNQVQIADVVTGARTSISGVEYWKNRVDSICSTKQGVSFTVLDVDHCSPEGKGSTNVTDCSLKRPVIYDVYLLDILTGNPIHSKSIFRLKAGDSVICCDLESMNLTCDALTKLKDVPFTIIPLKKNKQRHDSDKRNLNSFIRSQVGTDILGNSERAMSDVSTDNKKLNRGPNSYRVECDDDTSHSLEDRYNSVDIPMGVCELMNGLELG